MKRLELERRRRDLSQADLGEKLLYCKTMVSNLENGRLCADEVHKRLRKALEDYFGVTLEELLTNV
ncbi:MAG: helix-turn-helix domain-containing protein [Desulfomonilaceae bacterium]